MRFRAWHRVNGSELTSWKHFDQEIVLRHAAHFWFDFSYCLIRESVIEWEFRCHISSRSHFDCHCVICHHDAFAHRPVNVLCPNIYGAGYQKSKSAPPLFVGRWWKECIPPFWRRSGRKDFHYYGSDRKGRHFSLMKGHIFKLFAR